MPVAGRRKVSISLSSGFSFQDDEPILGGYHFYLVSISLSSGFSFQVKSHIKRRNAIKGFNLVIERLLISGSQQWEYHTYVYIEFQSRYRAASHFRFYGMCQPAPVFLVSISLSSGFSFQVSFWRIRHPIGFRRFNLVIERLLISG